MKLPIVFIIGLFFTINLSFSQTDDSALYCAKIITEKDKINGSLSYKSPTSNNIVFSCFTRKGEKIYMMHIKKVTKFKDSGYGVTILFDNGTKIYKHLKIAIRITDDTEFEHFINFKLDDKDIEQLKTNYIKEIALSKLNFSISQPEKYPAYLICIEKM